MGHVFASFFFALVMACCAHAAVPVDKDSEVKLSHELMERSEHLQPYTPENAVDVRPYDCVASFHAEHTFRPEQHWCLVADGDNYYIRVWTERSDMGAADVPTPERSRSISSTLAQSIRQLWLMAILESRYPPTFGSATDATVVTFTVRRYAIDERLYAVTLSPFSEHPPRWLTDIGLRIFDAALADTMNDPNLSRSVTNVANRVAEFYKR